MVEIIADIGSCQDYQKMAALVCAAKDSGADTAKIQMYTADGMTLDYEGFRAKHPWKGKLYDLYKELALPYEWVPKLKKIAKEIGIGFFTTVYHPDTVDIALGYGIDRFKIASFEIAYHDLLRRVADFPVVLSMGCASLGEIADAVTILSDVTLLYCKSAYPARLNELNLSTISDMKNRSLKIGFSDHTTGSSAAVIAVALGACVVEKHLTLGNGADDAFAIKPKKFKEMVRVIRRTETILGEPTYDPARKYARSMVAVMDIGKGEKTEGKVKALRTTEAGTMHISPVATRDYKRGDLVE